MQTADRPTAEALMAEALRLDAEAKLRRKGAEVRDAHPNYQPAAVITPYVVRNPKEVMEAKLAARREEVRAWAEANRPTPCRW
jgi:hypothetical protein